MAEATPNTPLQFMVTGFRFISWETASAEFMSLAYRMLARHGIRRFCLADPMNDAAATVAGARLVKKEGGEFVIAALVFTLSPIHDDAHYAECARQYAASPDIDAVYIEDPGGLLSQQRAATLIPGVMAQLRGKPLELHSHNTIGLADMTYIDAPNLGVSALQCASGAAADGFSNPPVERIVANLRSLGHRVDLDDDALARVSNYFTQLARGGRLRSGRPMGFDAAYLRHQLPGGTVGTMRRHLAEQPHRAPGRRRARRTRPRAPGTRLADRNDAVRADGDCAGGDERDRQGTLRDDSRRSDPLRAGPLRPAQRADRPARHGAHRGRCRAHASCARNRRWRRCPNCADASDPR